MKKINIKELLRVAIIAIISIGIFSAAFIAVNNRVFVASVSGGEILNLLQDQPPEEMFALLPQTEIINEADTALYEIENGEQLYYPQLVTEPLIPAFSPPTITIVENQWRRNMVTEIPAYVLSVEEAVQIGALYIWDVFGIHIDGLYVDMQYVTWPGNSRTYWDGTVSDRPDLFDVWIDVPEEFPPIRFMIDAVTGMRVDISRDMPRIIFVEADPMSEEEMNRFWRWREVVGEYLNRIRWHEMDTLSQITRMGLTHEDIEPYLQLARGYAARHFNNSVIVSETESYGVMHAHFTGTDNIDENGNVIIALGGVSIYVEDNTGREARVYLTFVPDGHVASIFTQHNDVIPGYWNFAPLLDGK